MAGERIATTLRTIFEANVIGFAGGEMGAVSGVTADGTVDEAWRTAWGAQDVTYSRGFWFRTPEAYDAEGNFCAGIYLRPLLRPLAIWALEYAIRQRDGAIPVPIPVATGG